MRERGIILTEGLVLGLIFVQRYRFLTIDQFARAAGMHRDTASRQLRSLELRRVLSHFGNACLPGHGRTPKVYFLTRKGWELLLRESDIPPELLGSHKEVKVDSRWSPQMYHRLRTVDLMISAEVAVRSRDRLSMAATFLEYRRVKRGTRVERETTDYVDKEENAYTRIIPDAAFILENIESGRRALFFLEMDMGTERIVSQITRDKRISLFYKISQYDRYLQGMRYRQTYSSFGDFRFFTLLFITIGEERVENIRRQMEKLPAELSEYGQN
jgi:Replication-relaxation